MKKEFKTTEKEIYISPDMRILEIETEQNILRNASGEGDVPDNDMDALDW